MSAAVLARETFSTSRLAEFCNRSELIRTTGYAVDTWPLYVVKELLDNSIDNCENLGIAPEIELAVTTDRIAVADNGSGLRDETLDRILNYNFRTSSNEAYVAPTRGQQGNALQTLFAMPFVLHGERGQVTVVAHGQAHKVEFRIHALTRAPLIQRTTAPSSVNSGTEITLAWPDSARHNPGRPKAAILTTRLCLRRPQPAPAASCERR